jgi:hypothetical protein
MVEKVRFSGVFRWQRRLVTGVIFIAIVVPGGAQNQQDGPTDLRSQVSQLQSALTTTQGQLADSQQQINELRKELQEIKALVGASGNIGIQQSQPETSGTFPTLENAVKETKPEATAPDDQQMLAARVEEQAQTKVESVSRYKVRLSGLILMNTYLNSGHVDITDLPMLAFRHQPGSTGGDFGATVRQSQLGLEVIGPHLVGASTGADVQADFFGGFPDANYGQTYGLFRLTLARAYMKWTNTTLVAGQDGLFFSPQSPTSYATLGEPAFAWAGNLWVWTPQVRLEHKWNVSENSNLSMQFGILDALTEEEPEDYFERVPTRGESSRVPAFAWHGSWNGKMSDRAATVGVGAYFARQAFGFNRNVDSWLVSADYNLPIASKLSWSGEIYRGSALGGLGGGVWNSYVSNGDPSLAATAVAGLGDVGGWSQLKFAPFSKLEFNVAAGTDNPLAKDLGRFPGAGSTNFPTLSRNQSIFVNSIYHPRSNVIFALEYRHLRTFDISPSKQSADHVNLAVGVSF